MKILFCFMGTLNPSCGGVERTMCNLIHELQDRGYECTVVGWYRNAPYAPFKYSEDTAHRGQGAAAAGLPAGHGGTGAGHHHP